MRRPLLLLIGVFALLWAAERTGPAIPDDITTMSGVATGLQSDAPDAPGGADQLWRVLHHPIVSVTESVWKSAPIHAGLAAMRGVRLLDVARSASSPDPPARSAPHYLRHTPLLI